MSNCNFLWLPAADMKKRKMGCVCVCVWLCVCFRMTWGLCVLEARCQGTSKVCPLRLKVIILFSLPSPSFRPTHHLIALAHTYTCMRKPPHVPMHALIDVNPKKMARLKQSAAVKIRTVGPLLLVWKLKYVITEYIKMLVFVFLSISCPYIEILLIK